MKTVFITGSDKGIGFEFAKQYAKEGWSVLASCYDLEVAQDVQQLAHENPHVKPYQLDVTYCSQIQTLADQLQGQQIDLLINNAGILGGEPFGQLDPMTVEQVFRTNALGPLMVSEAFHPLITKQTGTLVSISSKTASIGADQTEDMVAYRMSKAALNMAMQEVALKLKPSGIHVLLIAPGFVKTEMGGKSAKLEVSDSVSKMRQVIAKRNQLTSGGFYDRSGSPIPW